MEYQGYNGSPTPIISSADTSADVAIKARKRRRPPLSCIPCHRRKLKCDREFPTCGRCRTTAGQECVYRERSAQAQSNPTIKRNQRPSNPAMPVNGEEEPVWQRRAEGSAPLPPRYPPCSSERGEDDESTRSIHEVVLYKGNDYQTKFYGYSYHRNLYQQVFIPNPNARFYLVSYFLLYTRAHGKC